MQKIQYKNVHQVPTIKRIILNVGTGEPSANPGLHEDALKTLSLITGQKAVPTKAKKAISNFKIRLGQPIGCRVSLTGDRMWEFLDRFINLAVPRIRDFRGLSRRGMDGRGNFTLGLKEQIIFHEVDPDKIKKLHGMNITVCTSAPTDNEGIELLGALGMPFRKEKENLDKKKKRKKVQSSNQEIPQEKE